MPVFCVCDQCAHDLSLYKINRHKMGFHFHSRIHFHIYIHTMKKKKNGLIVFIFIFIFLLLLLLSIWREKKTVPFFFPRVKNISHNEKILVFSSRFRFFLLVENVMFWIRIVCVYIFHLLIRIIRKYFSLSLSHSLLSLWLCKMKKKHLQSSSIQL